MPTRAILLIAIVLGFAASAFAQQTSAPSDHPVVVLVGGQYGTPTEWLGTAGVLIARPKPFKPGTSPDSSRAGLVVTAGAGTGGFSLAAGGAFLALEGPFLTTGFDARFTLARTGHAPREAAADSTYVGGEAGLVNKSVRLAAGCCLTVGPSN
jgi:hypothetical protein